VFDDLYRRSTNFARSCVSHESQLVIQIASYCTHFARCNYSMDLNILFRADRLHTNVDGILSGSSNYIVHSHPFALLSLHTHRSNARIQFPA
jgi:hypothetical protein